MAAKKTPDGVAQRYELSRLGVFALRHSVFLKCQFDREYVFPKEEKVSTMWQATLRSLGVTDESGLGYQPKDGPSQPSSRVNALLGATSDLDDDDLEEVLLYALFRKTRQKGKKAKRSSWSPAASRANPAK